MIEDRRLVIGGCRDFTDYDYFREQVNFLIQNIRTQYNIIIVSGGCRGVDAMAERYAKENNLKCEIHFADWNRFGKYAGPKRNEEMVLCSDYVIAFWDFKSRGTKSLIEFAKQHNKSIKIKDIRKRC